MRVTERQIKFLIHQSNLIEGYDDPRFDSQGLVAWRYLLEIGFDQLDHHCIKKVQKIVTLMQTDLQPDDRGYYRKIQVYVGDHVVPAPALVQGLMDNWVLDYKEMDPTAAHVRFEKIHPFVDGNGRTGRLLMWWTQLKKEQPLSKILYVDRQKYYRWFK